VLGPKGRAILQTQHLRVLNCRTGAFSVFCSGREATVVARLVTFAAEGFPLRHD